MNTIVCEPLLPEREPEALALVRAVFDAHVAPEFSAQGCATFHDYIRQFAFSRRPGEAFALAARLGDAIVGVVDVIEGHHVALLFVDPALHGRGVGRTLVRRAAARCLRRDPPPPALTVNSSPNAVAAYRAMGFGPLSPEQERDGIRHTPMSLPLPVAAKRLPIVSP